MKHDYRISLLSIGETICLMVFKDSDPLPILEHAGLRGTEQAFACATDAIDIEESKYA